MPARFPGGFFLAAFLLAACGEGARYLNTPGQGPLVEGRGVYVVDMQGHPGELLLQANDTLLTLAYDTALCGLYQAWNGPVEGQAFTRDGVYLPQGPLFFSQPASVLWSLRNGQVTQPLRARFLGHAEDTLGGFILHYALALAGGDTAFVDEKPAFDNHYGDISLQREFRVSGLPPGMALRLRLGGTDGKWTPIWALSAAGSMEGSGGGETLTVTGDGVSVVKLLWSGSGAP